MSKPFITMSENDMFLVIVLLSGAITMALFRYLRWKHPERFKDD